MFKPILLVSLISISTCFSCFNRKKENPEIKKFELNDPKISLSFKKITNIDDVRFATNPIEVTIHNKMVRADLTFNGLTHTYASVIQKTNVENETDLNFAKSFIDKYSLITAENIDEIMTNCENFDYSKNLLSTVGFFTFDKLDTDFCPTQYHFFYYYNKEGKYMTLERFSIKYIYGVEINKEDYINYSYR